MNERDLFLAAAQKHDAADRAAFLGEACRGNEALRDEVEALLRERDLLGSFLEAPAARPGHLHGPRPADIGPGVFVGAYKLIEQIGEGGFGLVFMAEQEHPVRRTVAVKVLKPGMDSRQVIARFEAERQALALMDHPNIAKVLEVGETDSGRPYFAMAKKNHDQCKSTSMPATRNRRIDPP
jgi:non-specific serine/threonine protein kinase/serine/threonine-protein kinase